MSTNCLNCGNKLIHTEGRRQKKYCNEKCRVAYYQKEHKQKTVSFKSFQELKNKFDEVLAELNQYKYELPKDYQEIKSIGILKQDGTVEPFTEHSLKLLNKQKIANNFISDPNTIKIDSETIAKIKIEPIPTPKKEKAVKTLPPATRHEPIAHKQATDELAAILDEPKPIDGLITREEYSKLHWKEQAAYSIKFKKQFKK